MVIVEAETKPAVLEERVSLCARISSAEHKERLERQVEGLLGYYTVRDNLIALIIKEIASSINSSRPE
jgi:predicted site-specific integrase-resolvase